MKPNRLANPRKTVQYENLYNNESNFKKFKVAQFLYVRVLIRINIFKFIQFVHHRIKFNLKSYSYQFLILYLNAYTRYLEIDFEIVRVSIRRSFRSSTSRLTEFPLTMEKKNTCPLSSYYLRPTY